MAEPILQAVAAGNLEAMRACIDRFGGLVWSIVHRLPPTEAEDVVQEIFVEIWKNAGRFDPARGNEATFVAVIARRRFIDRLRQMDAAIVRLTPSGVSAGPQRPTAAPDAAATTADEVAEVLRAMEKLGPDHHRVLVLAVDRGLTHEQIALVTGLALGTVKTNIRRGLMRIRDILEERRQRRAPLTSGALEASTGKGAGQ